MTFKQYNKMTESVDINSVSYSQAIANRKKLHQELKKLRKIISTDYLKKFDQAMNMVYPTILENIFKKSNLNESYVDKAVADLANAAEDLLGLPYIKEYEPQIKKHFQNIARAIGYVIFAKIDPKVLVNESMNEEFKQEINEGLAAVLGVIGGGTLGAFMGGPAGMLFGAMIGGAAADEYLKPLDSVGDAAVAAYQGLKDVDWEVVVMNAGIGIGTIFGLLAGGGVGAMAGGVVGAALVGYFQKVHKKGDIRRFLKSSGNKGKSLSIKMYHKLLNPQISMRQLEVERIVLKQYQFRERAIKRL